jgi:hypothetical protein
MELMAAIAALEALKRPSTVELHTDSKYVQDGISKWIHGWKRNGWKTADKKPVKNIDLWQRLDAASAPRRAVALGQRPRRHELNERADRLAVARSRTSRAAARNKNPLSACAERAILRSRALQALQQIVGAGDVGLAGRVLDVERLHDAVSTTMA